MDRQSFENIGYKEVKKHPRPKLAWLLAHANFKSDECLRWPFKYSERADGAFRGVFRYGNSAISASRKMCELAHGRAPTSKHESAHSCGNSWCFNPNHLHWATKIENEADKIIHGRVAKGERNGSAKLTNEIVRQVKGRISSENETINAIADSLGVCHKTIQRIKNQTRWKE